MIGDTYSVYLTDAALEEIRDIAHYIATRYDAPQTARNVIESLQDGIMQLAESPTKRRLIDEEPWRAAGVRKLRVKEYYVYYYVREDILQVDIIGVAYIHRDQKEYLGTMKYKQ